MERYQKNKERDKMKSRLGKAMVFVFATVLSISVFAEKKTVIFSVVNPRIANAISSESEPKEITAAAYPDNVYIGNAVRIVFGQVLGLDISWTKRALQNIYHGILPTNNRQDYKISFYTQSAGNVYQVICYAEVSNRYVSLYGIQTSGEESVQFDNNESHSEINFSTPLLSKYIKGELAESN